MADYISQKQDRRGVVLGCVARYDDRIQKLRSRLSKYPGKELSVLKKGMSDLEGSIAWQESVLSDNPANISVRRKLSLLRSSKKLINFVVDAANKGRSIDDLLSPIGIEKVSRYDDVIDLLGKKGLVVRVEDPKDAASCIREAADYQLLVFGRRFEIPAPFSYILLKRQRIDDPFGVCLDYLIDCQSDERFGSQSSEKRSAFEKVARRSVFLHELARYLTEGMLDFGGIHLLAREKTRGYFESGKVTPERAYANVFGSLPKDRDYISIIFRGFDIHHQKTLLSSNNIEGLRMYLSGLVELGKPYAGGVEGKVDSRTSGGVYEPWINHVASFSGNRIPYSEWPNIEGSCHCKDSKYVARLHRKQEYTATYFCDHLIALFSAYADRILDSGRKVLSPFAFALDDQLEFNSKLENQVLFVRREDGKFKTPNRTESEWLLNKNAIDLGYGKALTTDYSEGRDALLRQLGRLT